MLKYDVQNAEWKTTNSIVATLSYTYNTYIMDHYRLNS